jgi:hypothetical protein
MPEVIVDNAWLSSVPESLRGNDVLKGHASLGEALQNYVDLKAKSNGMLAIPTEKSTNEERAAFTKAINGYLGVPDTIEGYEIQKPKLDEGMNYDEVLSDTMLKALHDAGTPKSIVHKVFEVYNKYQDDLWKQYNESLKQNSENRVKSLKDLWKEKFDENNKKAFASISKFVEKAGIPKGLYGDLEGPEALKKWLTDSGLENDPMQNYLWYRFFELVGDDYFEKGNPPGGGEDSNKPKVFSSYKETTK